MTAQAEAAVDTPPAVVVAATAGAAATAEVVAADTAAAAAVAAGGMVATEAVVADRHTVAAGAGTTMAELRPPRTMIEDTRGARAAGPGPVTGGDFWATDYVTAAAWAYP